MSAAVSVLQRIRRVAARPSLLARVLAGSAMLALLVTGTFVIFLVATSHLRRATNEQARAKDVTAATLGAVRLVNALDASLRAFVLTGNDRFLTGWRQAREQLPPALQRVDALVAQEPTQSLAAERLATLVSNYIDEYGRPLIVIARRRPDVARAPVAVKEGLFRITTIRNGFARLLASEDRLASARAASAKREADRAVRVGVASLAGTAALLLVFGLLLVRGVVRPVRTVAGAATRVAGGDLSTRLSEHGAAEVEELTRAFNVMARSLEQNQRELEAQNEQLRQSERLKSELVSIVSHELRTPLASILGYTSLLLKRDFPKDDAKRYVDIIHTQGRRLASLVDQFLDVETVEAGRIELHDEPFDLRRVLLEEAELVGRASPNHSIVVRVDAPVLPVCGDRDRLAQVYGNLLANAVKYSPDGGRIDVRGELNNGTVRVLVRDDGIGIAEENQPRIFTKFFRGEARESGISGTGLGLAVAREIVEAHGGRIGFTSTPGAGSTFWFELASRADEG